MKKLTTSDLIASNEKEFIDSINAELDWEAIEKLLLEKHNFALKDDVEYTQGDLVIHNNQIAYKMDFQIKIALSVTINRNGDCVDLSTSGDQDSFPDEDLDTLSLFEDEDVAAMDDDDTDRKKMTAMASNIAEMLSEINEENE